MLTTGSIVRWPQRLPLSWRTGATLVHDWLALLVAVVVAGHITMALTHLESLPGMLTGRVRRAWAEAHHPWWGAASGIGPSDRGGAAPRTARSFLVAAAGCSVVAAAGTLQFVCKYHSAQGMKGSLSVR